MKARRGAWKAVAFLVAAASAEYLAYKAMPYLPWPSGQGFLLPAELLLFLACLLVTASFLQWDGRPLASVGLALNRRWAGEVLVGILGGAAIMGATALAIGLLGGLHLVRTPGAGWGSLLAGAWVFLAVALHEELLFRGYLFQRLAGDRSPWFAQAAMGALFVAAHWGNPGMAGATLAWATLNIGLASLLLGLAYLRTRSLALPIGLHLGWNWTQGSLLGFGVSGTEAQGWWTPAFHGRAAWLTGGAFGLEASLPCTLICSLSILILYRVRLPKPPNSNDFGQD